MKKQKINIKNNKGITLIALIITIIVLLILATVSIKVVMDSGIIAHAQNAVNLYEKKAEEENKILSEYESILGGQPEKLSIRCEAGENGVIKVYLEMSGKDKIVPYEEYATKILEGKSYDEKVQLFIEGEIYHYKDDLPDKENMTLQDILDTWGYSTLDELVVDCGYTTLDEFLIKEEHVKPAEYHENYNRMKSKKTTVTCSNGQTKVSNMAFSYLEFTADKSGEYTFSAVGPEGQKAQTTINVNLTNPVEKITVLGGDVNGDGEISAADYSGVKIYLLGGKKDSYPIYLFDVGDVDGDGYISEKDMEYIKGAALGASYEDAIYLNKPIEVVKKQ